MQAQFAACLFPLEVAQDLHPEQHFIFHLRHDGGGDAFKLPAAKAEFIKNNEADIGDTVGSTDAAAPARLQADAPRQIVAQGHATRARIEHENDRFTVDGARGAEVAVCGDFQGEDTIYRLRVRAHKTAPHWFMLLRILQANAPDDALVAMRDAYRHPSIWQEAPLAIPLTLDTTFHHYKGEADWLGQPVCIMLDRDENNPAQPAPAAVATLNRLFDSLDNRRYWNERLINHAARSLAATGESGGLDAAALARCLRLAELAIGADGAFTAWLDAGDTFDGEPVSLGVTPAGELDDPCIGT